jgi:ribosome maturation factor RimP
MDTVSRIKEISIRAVEEHKMLFIDFVTRVEGRYKVIEVFIDNEAGVTADLCAEISRSINKIIEEEDLYDGPYRFDVSSPGVNRPLVYLQQYKKHTGRLFEIVYIESEESKKLKGKLLIVEDDKLTFELNSETKTLSFSEIQNAKVKVSF